MLPTDERNLLRAWRFQNPERIPVVVNIPPASWRLYGKELEKIVLRHPLLFPGYQSGETDFDNLYMDPRTKAGKPFTDAWGCVYEPRTDDVPCYVTQRPLASWDAFDDFVPPDPDVTDGIYNVDWDKIGETMRAVRAADGVPSGPLVHGHCFLLLENLRGYENLIMDMVDDHPNLLKLLAMVEVFSLRIVHRYLALGIDMMEYPEDLGAQDRPMISPALFRRYIKPVYTRIMAPAKEAGVLVHMHSDGYLWDLIDDLLECGVDVINPQDLVNGIDRLAAELKGRVAIDLDIDRQRIIPFGTPAEIDDLIREAVMKLGDPQGGLSLRHGLYTGAPLENIDALMTAMEKYSTFYT